MLWIFSRGVLLRDFLWVAIGVCVWYVWTKMDFNMDDIFDRLLILRSPGVGPVGYKKLIRQFGSVAGAADNLRNDVALCDAVRCEMDVAAENSVQFITDDSEYYPVSLKNVKNHPRKRSSPLVNMEKIRVGIIGAGWIACRMGETR